MNAVFNPLCPPILGEEKKELGDTPKPPAGDALLHLSWARRRGNLTFFLYSRLRENDRE
jgi:hypothetical protein